MTDQLKHYKYINNPKSDISRVKLEKKRILVTPSDEMYTLISRYSNFLGQPKATVIRELLDSNIQNLSNLIDVAENAQNDPEQFFNFVINYAESQVKKSKQLSLDLNLNKKKFTSSKRKPKKP